jgi:hypothetical protein
VNEPQYCHVPGGDRRKKNDPMIVEIDVVHIHTAQAIDGEGGHDFVV